MSEKTIIAWCDHTWNLAWGCTKISAGCAHCYADTLSQMYGWKDGGGSGPKLWGPNSERRTFGAKYWEKPIEWNRLRTAGVMGKGGPHLVFCSSMCDVFEDHPTMNREREKLWPLIRATPRLHWQLLTKRPERIADNLPSDWGDGYPNVWLGTSIEDMRVAGRADHLRSIPAVVRFVSYEPALGSLADLDIAGLDWIIFGGESGSGYRPAPHEWAREMRAKCEVEGAAFFFKQSAAHRTEMGIELDGQIVRKFPAPRTVNAFALV